MSIVSSPLSDFPILPLCRKSESKQMSLEVTIAKHNSLDIQSPGGTSLLSYLCVLVLYSYNKLNTSHMIQSSNNVCSSRKKPGVVYYEDGYIDYLLQNETMLRLCTYCARNVRTLAIWSTHDFRLISTLYKYVYIYMYVYIYILYTL